MTNHSAPSVAEAFSAFAQFSEDIWTPSKPDALTDADYTVMALGLCGECGETLEVLVDGWDGTPAAKTELVLELGDCIHYWARIAKAFGMNAGELAKWGLVTRGGADQGGPEGELARQAEGLRLGAAAGRVAEVLKKRVRDGRFDGRLFEDAMTRTARHWFELCRLCGIDWREVLLENRRKLAAKYGLSDEVAGLVISA